MQFTCPAVMPIASLVASGISSVGFSRSDICSYCQLVSNVVWNTGQFERFVC